MDIIKMSIRIEKLEKQVQELEDLVENYKIYQEIKKENKLLDRISNAELDWLQLNSKDIAD